MKLCFINPTEMHRAVVYELAKYLAMKKNYEITILQPTGSRRLRKQGYLKPFHSANIEIIYLPSFFLRSLYYTFPHFHKEFEILCKLVSELKCEVIQACEYAFLTSIAPIFVKRRYKIATVLTFGELLGYTWFYGDTVIDTIAKTYTYSLGKWVFNSYDKAVSLTKIAAEGAKRFGIPRDKVSTIPNGVDLRNFRLGSNLDEIRDELSIKQNDKVLLFVGRLSKVKRIEVLITLTRQLLKEGFSVKTVVVGDGPSREHYEKLAESIKSHVIFTGWLPRSQIYRYYNIADVFVLPSLSEGLPSALLEASAAGKPCVASNVGGVPDVTVHGETGYLVDRSDINSYARCVKILLANEDLSREMGRKAAEHVKENFNWDVVVDKYEKIYQHILDQ